MWRWRSSPAVCNRRCRHQKLLVIKILVLVGCILAVLRPFKTPEKSPTRRSEAELIELIQNSSVRCGDIQRVFNHRIPPVIHWTNKNDLVLKQHQDLLLSWTRILGSSFVYMYWTDSDVEELIKRHYQQVWERYRRFTVGIMRSDIARLVILHHVGGAYADLDVRLLKSIHPLMQNSSAVWSQEPHEHIHFLYKRTRLISNAFFMSKAKHPFLEFVLSTWPQWFDSKSANQKYFLDNPYNAVYITGPLMLNEFLDRYDNASKLEAGFLAEPDTFQPTWDTLGVRIVAQRVCLNPSRSMPRKARVLCSLLNSRQYRTRDVTNASYTVHMYMHTSYGNSVNSYIGTKFAKEILPLSRCVI